MPKTVVIIEDDRNIAKAQEMILSKKFKVHTAFDGEQGYSMVKKIRPDLVILDIMLPKLDGFSLCKKIKQDSQLSKTKILMVTAKNEVKDEMNGLEFGADDYIMKPFEPIELEHVVSQVLSKK